MRRVRRSRSTRECLASALRRLHASPRRRRRSLPRRCLAGDVQAGDGGSQSKDDLSDLDWVAGLVAPVKTPEP